MKTTHISLMKDYGATPTLHIPVLPTRNTVVFPDTTLPLLVGRKVSMEALARAREKDNWILIIAPKTEAADREPTSRDLYTVGTLAKIENSEGDPSLGFRVLVRGVARFKVDSFTESGRLILASGDVLRDERGTGTETVDALVENLKQIASEILKLLPGDTHRAEDFIKSLDDPETLTNVCAQYLDLPIAEKQSILELTNFKDRALLLLDLLVKRKEELKVQHEIGEKLSNKMGKLQRESILREQMRTIREELGEEGEAGEKDYRQKIDEAGMPDEVKKVALEQLKRLESIGNQSPESHVIRNYLDLLCALPWSKASTSAIDLTVAREILDKEHFGLDEVKKRIIQHLAVMKLKKGKKGSILVLVGPPGVGKTSLGQSIAKALGRKFVRASLGGVRDEAEIRGHRRTYVGALPGRIIEGMKRAGENNPVFMLDEIDKLTRGWGGDPSSALLETLDPEQNHTFMDHYLDVPFDLSNVFFIATANSMETIPGPLLDRMEIIQLSGYTHNEKLHIARNHLVPKQIEEHGLTAKQIEITENALMKMISSYTREAGVRDLQRRIAAVCRASTEKVLNPLTKLPVVIDEKDLGDILGREKFSFDVAEMLAPAGVVTGLAWTPLGGDILFIESSLMPGSGKLTLTGQLGDVMKESAQIALSLVRSQLAAAVAGYEFEKNDIHVHVPAGAIPKDGPSAGITMFTALASLVTRRPVNPKLAMTGEITLRGAVMPVGGIKEKMIAAHRAGIREVILARKNEPDLRDVPDEVKQDLKFHFVDRADEVLKVALGFNEYQLRVPLLSAAPAPTSPPASGGGTGLSS
ncbi:MAG: endopeptidase La [Bdellovibrionaceae bacterium]|nr:endopeptidase La [Pseudobdellovibrionaceae bacterium]